MEPAKWIQYHCADSPILVCKVCKQTRFKLDWKNECIRCRFLNGTAPMFSVTQHLPRGSFCSNCSLMTTCPTHLPWKNNTEHRVTICGIAQCLFDAGIVKNTSCTCIVVEVKRCIIKDV